MKAVFVCCESNKDRHKENFSSPPREHHHHHFAPQTQEIDLELYG